MIRLRINASTASKKYTWQDYEVFKDQYMRGFARPTDAPDNELAAAISFLANERRKAERHEDRVEAAQIEKQLDTLRDAKNTKKKMQNGTYELERQITNDIWSCVHGTDADYDALKEVRAKYRDNASLYRRIENRILSKERWYD